MRAMRRTKALIMPKSNFANWIAPAADGKNLFYSPSSCFSFGSVALAQIR